MAKYTVEGGTLTAIANAIRQKTGAADPIAVKDMPTRIAGITAGGGSCADVRYVTFMNGDTVLYKKPVAVGDDCVDVLQKGLIDIPTKESTVQYDYTYSGWSLTDGGRVSSAALTAVTEDRTVYAVYTAAVRSYTVSYYDGEMLLKSEVLPYGSVPAYTPEKEGYGFEGWQPELAQVTGDAIYYAQWTEVLTFANASWEKIAELAESGEAESVFGKKATKEITVNYADGTTENITVEIVAFDSDDLADGSGTAGITCLMTAPLATPRSMGDYSITSTSHSYSKSDMHAWLNADFLTALPAELQAVVKSVKKYMSTATSQNSTKPLLSNTTAKCWIPGMVEMGWLDPTNGSLPTRTYSGISRYINKMYWLRDQPGAGSFNRNCYAVANTTDGYSTVSGTSSYYVRIGFCI